MKLETSNIKKYRMVYSKSVKMKRLLWNVTWLVFIRPLPRWTFKKWRRLLYRLFGATIPSTSGIHPSSRVFMPWNLKMGEYSVIGSKTTIYNTTSVYIGDACVISEGAYLCTTSHNVQSIYHEQIDSPITIMNHAWVATQAFIGMGITIGEGAVIGARACVFRDVDSWTIVGGNPAKFIKKREIK